MRLDYLNKVFFSIKNSNKLKSFCTDQVVIDYTWERIYTLEIMQWPDTYVIYCVKQQIGVLNDTTTNSDWVLTLLIDDENFIVYTKTQTFIEKKKIVSRYYFYENLKRYNEENYKLIYNGPAQKYIGNILDGLIYVCKQGDKIITQNPLSKEDIIKQREEFYKIKKN